MATSLYKLLSLTVKRLAHFISLSLVIGFILSHEYLECVSVEITSVLPLTLDSSGLVVSTYLTENLGLNLCKSKDICRESFNTYFLIKPWQMSKWAHKYFTIKEWFK